MAAVEPAHVCAAEPYLRKLSRRELAAVLSELPHPLRADCLRTAGLRPRSNAPLERVANLLGARLRSLDGAAGHNVAAVLTSPAREQLLFVVGDDEDRLVEDVARGLKGPLASWPRPLLAALFALLGELGAYPTSSRDELLELLARENDQLAHRPDDPDDSPLALPAELVAPSSPPFPHVRSVSHVAPSAVHPQSETSALDTVFTEALLRGHARSAGPTLEAAAQAVDELLLLDGMRPGSWRLRGLADGLAATPLESDSPAPPTPELAQHKLVGLLEALLYRGRGDDIAALVRSHRREIDRHVSAWSQCEMVEPLLTALLDRDPTLARELLLVVPHPFMGWRGVIDGVLRSAARLAATDPVAAGALLRAGDDMLTAWTPELSGGDLDDVEQAAAELAVERVGCHRRSADFRGAFSLLGRIDRGALSHYSHARLLEEAALIAANVSSLESIGFPDSPPESELARRRLDRARPEIEAAVAGGSERTGRVLRAVSSVAEGDHGPAVADLRVVCGAMAEDADLSTDDRRLLAKLEFQLGLSELCLLDPGGAAAPLLRIERAMAAGHRASSSALVLVATVLDAHGSPEATTMIGRALGMSPLDASALDLLAGMARRVVPGAAALAAENGSNIRLPRRVRFELLDAALTGAGSGTEQIDLETVVDDLERLVANAADAELDQRWASRLGNDDVIRSTLGADALDLVRLSVLRRSGCVSEAASVARKLFHRSLSGHVEGVDAGDLLELLGQLGTGDDEARDLRLLLPSAAHPAAAADAGDRQPLRVLVLFVGGNETQSRSRSSVERAMLAAHGDTVTVEWFSTGWGSNWAAAAAAIESRYIEADVLILMTFIRTMLGRRLRRTAGEADIPWVACTGHGRASIERAIDRAVAVSRSRDRSRRGE